MAFSSRPPPSSQPPRGKRPWYLAVALVCGWLFGAGRLMSGCNTIAFYKSDVDVEDAVQQFSDEAHRALVAPQVQQYFAILDAARNRMFPLGVAALLLGGAMVAISARALRGRAAARAALVQIALVQAAFGVLRYALTPDVRHAEVQLEQARGLGSFARYVEPVYLGVGIAANLLIVLALTRPASRAFFEPAPRS